jgi:hypothetical protein
MSTLTARDGRAECISVAQLMFLERSRAFYCERCSRVASSNTRITKHLNNLNSCRSADCFEIGNLSTHVLVVVDDDSSRSSRSEKS